MEESFSNIFHSVEIYKQKSALRVCVCVVFNTKYGETFGVDTGKFTGRSPKDKWIVKSATSGKNIWWGDINQPTTPKVFDSILNKATNHNQ